MPKRLNNRLCRLLCIARGVVVLMGSVPYWHLASLYLRGQKKPRAIGVAQRNKSRRPYDLRRLPAAVPEASAALYFGAFFVAVRRVVVRRFPTDVPVLEERLHDRDQAG
ncbi:hypothetical protein PSEUDO8AS_20325 [Pseudomonas sp. 8AS]|nr:hypothetical protein PSEUDO8AS_20325 [Pseudomonas sp. 8AS]